MISEESVRGFEVPDPTKRDVLEFSRIFERESPGPAEEIQCRPSLPDGIKVVLTTAQRRLTLFFFGDQRFIFGQSLIPGGERLQTGECSLAENHRPVRESLFSWLNDGTSAAAG